MNPLEWFEKLWKGTGRSNQYLALSPERVRLTTGAQGDNTELRAGEHYFRLLLVEMFLAKDRKWLTDWFPIVYTAISFKFGDQEELLTHVAGESFLKQLGQQRPGRVIGLNYPLTPLLPFNGGTVELTSALVGVAGGNDVLATLRILGSFSQLLLVPQLSAALTVATPLAEGVAGFIGATQNQMLLALHQMWGSAAGGANILRAGYFAAIAADSKMIDPQKLFVVDDGLRYGNTIETSAPLTGYDYMLFRLERRDERDDWDSLTSIQKPYQRAIEMLEGGNIDQGDAFIRSAKAAAFTAKELTAKVDRRRVLEKLESDYQEAKDSLLTGGARAFGDSEEAKLSNLMKSAIRPDQAAKMGIVIPEFFGLEGMRNHSLTKFSKNLSIGLGSDSETRESVSEEAPWPEQAEWPLEEAGPEDETGPAEEPGPAKEALNENFFFALKGEQVHGNTVQKGSEFDLVFDYAVPTTDVVATITGRELEKARTNDWTLGMMVSPRGFLFTREKESGFRQIGFKNGEIAGGPVVFQLKAFDSKRYKKAFTVPRGEKINDADREDAVPIYSTGFHIAFDVNGVQIYRFFLPVKLVGKITGNDGFDAPSRLDLDKLNESSQYVVKARGDLNEAVAAILAGKEAW